MAAGTPEIPPSLPPVLPHNPCSRSTHLLRLFWMTFPSGALHVIGALTAIPQYPLFLFSMPSLVLIATTQKIYSKKRKQQEELTAYRRKQPPEERVYQAPHLSSEGLSTLHKKHIHKVETAKRDAIEEEIQQATYYLDQNIVMKNDDVDFAALWDTFNLHDDDFSALQVPKFKINDQLSLIYFHKVYTAYHTGLASKGNDYDLTFEEALEIINLVQDHALSHPYNEKQAWSGILPFLSSREALQIRELGHSYYILYQRIWYEREDPRSTLSVPRLIPTNAYKSTALFNFSPLHPDPQFPQHYKREKRSKNLSLSHSFDPPSLTIDDKERGAFSKTQEQGSFLLQIYYNNDEHVTRYTIIHKITATQRSITLPPGKEIKHLSLVVPETLNPRGEMPSEILLASDKQCYLQEIALPNNGWEDKCLDGKPLPPPLIEFDPQGAFIQDLEKRLLSREPLVGMTVKDNHILGVHPHLGAFILPLAHTPPPSSAHAASSSSSSSTASSSSTQPPAHLLPHQSHFVLTMDDLDAFDLYVPHTLPPRPRGNIDSLYEQFLRSRYACESHMTYCACEFYIVYDDGHYERCDLSADGRPSSHNYNRTLLSRSTNIIGFLLRSRGNLEKVEFRVSDQIFTIETSGQDPFLFSPLLYASLQSMLTILSGEPIQDSIRAMQEAYRASSVPPVVIRDLQSAMKYENIYIATLLDRKVLIYNTNDPSNPLSITTEEPITYMHMRSPTDCLTIHPTRVTRHEKEETSSTFIATDLIDCSLQPSLGMEICNYQVQGDVLALQHPRYISLHSISTTSIFALFHHSSRITSFCLDGPLLAFSDNHHRVHLWNTGEAKTLSVAPPSLASLSITDSTHTYRVLDEDGNNHAILQYEDPQAPSFTLTDQPQRAHLALQPQRAYGEEIREIVEEIGYPIFIKELIITKEKGKIVAVKDKEITIITDARELEQYVKQKGTRTSESHISIHPLYTTERTLLLSHPLSFCLEATHSRPVVGLRDLEELDESISFWCTIPSGPLQFLNQPLGDADVLSVAISSSLAPKIECERVYDDEEDHPPAYRLASQNPADQPTAYGSLYFERGLEDLNSAVPTSFLAGYDAGAIRPCLSLDLHDILHPTFNNYHFTDATNITFAFLPKLYVTDDKQHKYMITELCVTVPVINNGGYWQRNPQSALAQVRIPLS